ncbi:MAG: NTP transferase domain-containing protein [Blautia sp.]|nr:NTP transferase domain-containing protein [Blautia sp.]
MKQGIILAAGLGRRLKEVTFKTPKSLIRVDGVPILERNIQYMIDSGCARVVIVVGYMKERFSYLAGKYKEVVIVENPDYDSTNTVSSMNCASRYFDYDSFVTTADIYLRENLFQKYGDDYSFYLLRPYDNFEKPDWVAVLDENNRFVSVDTRAIEGFSYTGISFWKKKDLDYIKHKLSLVDWENEKERQQYWDELHIHDYSTFELHAKILKDDNEIYEFDDMSDIEKLQKTDSVTIEW